MIVLILENWILSYDKKKMTKRCFLCLQSFFYLKNVRNVWRWQSFVSLFGDCSALLTWPRYSRTFIISNSITCNCARGRSTTTIIITVPGNAVQLLRLFAGKDRSSKGFILGAGRWPSDGMSARLSPDDPLLFFASKLPSLLRCGCRWVNAREIMKRILFVHTCYIFTPFLQKYSSFYSYNCREFLLIIR